MGAWPEGHMCLLAHDRSGSVAVSVVLFALQLETNKISNCFQL